jgi:2-dehydropantoate 2-reductase
VSGVPAIAILGPGGVGGFLAAALARAGEDVVVVARADTAAAIARDGIAVRSVRLGDFAAAPPATAALTAPVDLLLVATKATGLAAALDRIEAEPTLVVPLLNGLDHMRVLHARFGSERVLAGTIRIESHRVAPGRIVQSSPSFRVELASDDPALRPDVQRLGATLENAGIPVEVGTSEAQILWSKLVRLCALACTTTAADRALGFIRRDPEWREALVACIREATAVANADGARIDAADRIGELDAAHPELGSSMQRDLAAGREPELDAIAGSVLRAAARHELACPTIARLAGQIAQRSGLPAPRI